MRSLGIRKRDALGQPALLGELLQVRSQGERGGGAQLRGGVGPGRVEQLVLAARPRLSASTSRRSRSSRWAMYSSSLAPGFVTYGPWPGQSTARSSARSRRNESR